MTHYLAGTGLAMWLLLVSDDLLAISGRIRQTLIKVTVVYLVLGIPVGWEKVSGGDELPWVGFEVNL